MSKIDFYLATKAQYDALEEKDNQTLYFITDTYQIFVGSKPYSHPVKIVSALPDASEISMGTIYANTASHSFNVYDGSKWLTLGPTPVASTISGNGMVTEAASTRAVVNYIKGIADSLVKSVAISNKKLIVTKYDNSSTTIDIQGFIDGCSFDEANSRLIFTTNGGQQIPVPIPSSSDDFLVSGSWHVVTAADVTHEPFIDYEPGDTGLLLVMESGNRIFIEITLPSGGSIDIGTGKTDEIIIAKSNGNVKASGKKIGGASLKSSPDANTVATELAVKNALNQLPISDGSYILRMTRPVSDEALTPVVEVSNTPDFRSVICEFAKIDISSNGILASIVGQVSNPFFKVFDGESWIDFPEDGYLGTPFDNMPVIVNLNDCRTTEFFGSEENIPNRLYVRYYWLSADGSESNYQAAVVPSTSLQEPLQDIPPIGSLKEKEDDRSIIVSIPELEGGVQYQYGRGLQGLNIASTVDTSQESEILFVARNAMTLSSVQIIANSYTPITYAEDYTFDPGVGRHLFNFNPENNWTVSVLYDAGISNQPGNYGISCSMIAKLVKTENDEYVISCIGSNFITLNHMDDSDPTIVVNDSYDGIFASSVDMETWEIVNSSCLIGGYEVQSVDEFSENAIYGSYGDFVVSGNMQAENYACPVTYPGSVALFASSSMMEFSAGNKYVLNFRNNQLGAAQVFLPESGIGVYLESGNSVISKKWLIESTIISSGNSLIAYSQGETDDIIVNSHGSIFVRGGKIYDTTINSSGFLSISGGLVSSLVTNGPVTIEIYDDLDAIENINGNAKLNIVDNQISLKPKTTISGLIIGSAGVLINHHVQQNNVQINHGGSVTNDSDGSINNITLDSFTSLTVNGGDVQNIVAHGSTGATTKIFIGGGNVNNVSVVGLTEIRVSNNGVVSGISGSAAWTYAVDGGIVSGISYTGNAKTRIRGGSVFDASINRSNAYEVSSGYLISSIISNGGTVTILSGGTAEDIEILSGGKAIVSNGGYATVKVHDGGIFDPKDGAIYTSTHI